MKLPARRQPCQSGHRRRRCGRRLQLERLQARQLLAADVMIAGIEAPPESELNHAALSLIDLRDNQVSPVTSASRVDMTTTDAMEGISGLAVLRDGRVVATVAAESPATSSELVIRQSVEGDVISRVPIRLGGETIAIGDLASNPTTDRVLGVTANEPGQTSRLVEIDVQTGQATLLGDTSLSGRVALAIDGQGKLYATSQDHGFAPLKVNELDATTGSVLSSFAIVDETPFGLTTGLAINPEDGLIYGTESHLGRFFSIDPQTQVRQFLPTQAPLRGVSGDLAFVTRRDSDSVSQIFHADFNEGSDGFTFDNTLGQFAGLWHRSIGRREDGLLNHSLNGSFYYGKFEDANGGGNTILDYHHHGVLSSPEIDLPADGTSILSFSYLLDTRPELDRDFVSVIVHGESSNDRVLARDQGTLPETAGDWLTATIDLSAYAGQTITVDFDFNSGDPVLVDPEGWYVDDVVVVHLQDARPLSVDLAVTKSASETSFQPGENVVYTVGVTNQVASEGTADGVAVVDTLPAEVEFVSASDGGIYDPVTHSVRWSGLTLARGEGRDLSLVVQVNEQAGGEPWMCDDEITNRVVVESNSTEIDPSDNEFTLVSPVACVDLVIEKTPSMSNAKAGDRVEFTLTARNISETTATGIVVIDTLPAGLTAIPDESTPGLVVDGDEVRWEADELAANATLTWTLVVQVDEPTAETTEVLTNSVNVSSKQPEQTPADNTDTADVIRDPREVDLSVEKTAAPLQVSPDELLSYTIVVTNLASSEKASGPITVIDELPTGVTVIPESASAEFTVNPDGSLQWIIDPLPIDESITIEFDVRTSDTCDHGNELINRVTVQSGDLDPNVDNNVAEAIATLSCPAADLVVSKSADLDQVLPGNALAYTIVVQHTGESNVPATNVKVVDTLPIGVTLNESATTPGFTFDGGREVTWTIDQLAIDQQREFTLAVVVDPLANDQDSEISNLVTVTADEPDSNPANNTDEVGTDVLAPRVDLVLQKTADLTNPSPGELLTYTLTITNGIGDQLGQANFVDATNVVVTDMLPSGVTYLGAQPAPTTTVGNELTWEFATLAAGQSQTILVSVLVDEDAGGRRLVNAAVVDADQTDLDNASDSVQLATVPMQSVQFIAPLSVFRNAPLVDVADGTETIPATGAISGYLWIDDDLDGVWDDSEVTLPGVEVYLDLNRNGQADLVPDEDGNVEPLVLTDANGRYVFTGLEPGEYLVRADYVQFDEGPLLSQNFPLGFDDFTDFRTPAGHTVTLADTSVIADLGETVAPNFGSAFYSPIVRPADQFGAVINLPRYQNAVQAFQSFAVVNDTESVMQIDAIEKHFDSQDARYVQLYEVVTQTVGGVAQTTWQVIANPAEINRSLQIGDTITFAAVYDPAVRSRGEDPGVITQSPEWLGTRTPTTEFNSNDQLIVRATLTDSSNSVNYPVALTGGSTFDSDITYDGRVQLNDLIRLQTLLQRHDNVLPSNDPEFDRTSDINARCPNGASQVVNSCSWEFDGETPMREISLGDYGPLNVEAVVTQNDEGLDVPSSQRSLFLDLDVNNDRGGLADAALAGLGYLANYADDGVAIVDEDAFFAGPVARRIAELRVSIQNAQAGDRLQFVGELPMDAELSAEASELVFRNLSVGELELAFQRIRFVADDTTAQIGRQVEIAFTSEDLAVTPTAKVIVKPDSA